MSPDDDWDRLLDEDYDLDRQEGLHRAQMRGMNLVGTDLRGANLICVVRI